MKDLILIGGGSYGREVASGIEGWLGYNKEWRFKGFLDNQLDRSGVEELIIGLVSEYEPNPNDVFACTLPEQRYRRRYVELITGKGGRFISLQHRSAEISADVNIGVGTLIGPFCSAGSKATIGDYSILNSHVAVGHDALIGAYAHINAFTLISGFAELEEEVTIHPQSSVLPGKKVGMGATVGIGSIVMRNVKPGVTVFGNPAREI